MEMRINLGCTTVILHEDANLKRSSISLRAMCKTITKGYSGVLVEFRGISIEDLGAAVEELVAREVQQLLESYSDLFELPKGLPLHRSTDHAIISQEGTNPINVRPYRYPHF